MVHEPPCRRSGGLTVVSSDYRPPVTDQSPGRVLVYREEFLQPSETFIRDHLVDMPRYSVAAMANELLPRRLEVPGVPVHLTRARGPVAKAVQYGGYRLGAPKAKMVEIVTRATLRRLKPDLVHAHFGPDAAYIATATTAERVPLVATFHGFDLTKSAEALRGQRVAYDVYLDMGPALYPRLAAIITVSDFLRRELVARGVDADDIDVIPCGVDTSSIAWTPARPDGPVLFVGRLTAKKGVADLIRAIGLMPEPPPLVVIGDGPLRTELETLAAALRLAIDFRGVQDSEEVAGAIREASVVAMPSRRAPTGDAEGLGVVALEAQAAGRPVVGYAHGGLSEAVLDGETGRLVREGDVKALAAALEQVRSRPDLLADFAGAGRRHVERNFERSMLLGRVADVYDRALDQHRRSSSPVRRYQGPTGDRDAA